MRAICIAILLLLVGAGIAHAREGSEFNEIRLNNGKVLKNAFIPTITDIQTAKEKGYIVGMWEDGGGQLKLNDLPKTVLKTLGFEIADKNATDVQPQVSSPDSKRSAAIQKAEELGAVRFRNSYYLLIPELKTWDQASAKCKKLGGHLVTVSDAAENDFVATLASKYGRIPHYEVFLGATDRQVEGKWEWITGEPFKYTKWLEGEPSNQTGREDVIGLVPSRGGRWNDGGGKHFFMCEWDVEEQDIESPSASGLSGKTSDERTATREERKENPTVPPVEQKTGEAIGDTVVTHDTFVHPNTDDFDMKSAKLFKNAVVKKLQDSAGYCKIHYQSTHASIIGYILKMDTKPLEQETSVKEVLTSNQKAKVYTRFKSTAFTCDKQTFRPCGSFKVKHLELQKGEEGDRYTLVRFATNLVDIRGMVSNTLLMKQEEIAAINEMKERARLAKEAEKRRKAEAQLRAINREYAENKKKRQRTQMEESQLKDLLTIYKQNEFAGDKEWKGKRFNFVGLVEKVAKDHSTGLPYIELRYATLKRYIDKKLYLKGYNDCWVWEVRKSSNYARCLLPEKFAYSIGDLRPSHVVQLAAKCKGVQYGVVQLEATTGILANYGPINKLED